MTNAKDFRPGNQVLHTASGATVTVIKVLDGRLLLESFPKSNYWSVNDFSGIPLSIEMLRQLSFSKDDNNNTWRGQGIGIDLKQDGIFYGLRISKNKTKIQYLHQLQNYVTDFYASFWQQKQELDIGALYK